MNKSQNEAVEYCNCRNYIPKQGKVLRDALRISDEPLTGLEEIEEELFSHKGWIAFIIFSVLLASVLGSIYQYEKRMTELNIEAISRGK